MVVNMFDPYRLMLALALLCATTLGCTDSDVDNEDGTGFELCSDDEPTCVEDCTGEAEVAPDCVDGEWLCPQETVNRRSCPPADDQCAGATPECVDFCGSDALHAAECVEGDWRCPDGAVEMDECPPDTCWGAPAPCVDTCIEPEVYEEASCSEHGRWTCPENMLQEDRCPTPSCEVTSTSTIPGVRLEFLGERCLWLFIEVEQGGEIPYRMVVEEPIEVNLYPPSSRMCEREEARTLLIEEVIRGRDGQSYCRCDVGLCASPEPEWITLEPGVTYHTFEWAPYNWNGPSDTGEEYGERFWPGEFSATVDTHVQVRREDGTVEDVRAESTMTFYLYEGE